MRRIDIENGEADTLAGNPASPFGPPSGPTVIPFRRVASAAASDLAGCSETSSGHPFIPLGKAVSAVIMRVGSSRLRAFGPVSVGAGGKDRAEDDGSPGS